MLTTTACLPYTALICSMLVLPVLARVRWYSSATATESLPMDTLSAPDLREYKHGCMHAWINRVFAPSRMHGQPQAFQTSESAMGK
jgi:hypothetical protein